MKALKAALLATIGNLPHEDVALPEVGNDAKVRVSVMTGIERDEFDRVWREMRARDGDRTLGFRTLLVVFTARDPDSGERLFGVADVAQIDMMPAPVVVRLADSALKLNGFAAGAVEKAEKNS